LHVCQQVAEVPVFEYRCESCGGTSEAIVLPGEQAPERCSECGGELRRRWSRVGARLVGWGFSRNDALLPDRPGRRPFEEIRKKADELFD
jgi:putative FmdB family regulatory protein